MQSRGRKPGWIMNRAREMQGRRGTEGGYDLSTCKQHNVSQTHTNLKTDII